MSDEEGNDVMMSGHELIEILIKETASLTMCLISLRREKALLIFTGILK